MKEEPGTKPILELLPARLWRLFWLTVLVGHVVLGGAWWWLEPGGFGVRHPRFWANSVAPIVGLGLSIGSLAGTSIGRGWDCVGHNPGTHRNRIYLEIAKTGDP